MGLFFNIAPKDSTRLRHKDEEETLIVGTDTTLRNMRPAGVKTRDILLLDFTFRVSTNDLRIEVRRLMRTGEEGGSQG